MAQARDRGAFEALSRKKRGRPGTDPREREVAQLQRKVERFEGDLSKARKVIEVQGKLSALLEELASESESRQRAAAMIEDAVAELVPSWVYATPVER